MKQAHARLSGSGAAVADAGDAINAGFGYLEVKCLGCDTHQTVALDIVRRPKTTPVHELERYMRCKDCSEVRGYPYKRSHLVALRAAKISASDPPDQPWRIAILQSAPRPSRDQVSVTATTTLLLNFDDISP